MSTITTRAGKGSPLTNNEVDANFTNLNDDKLENVSEDTTPQLGGDLDTNGNDIKFGDNDKATFGAGDDLQIYHDGSHSIITDVGTGNLDLKGSAAVYIKATGTDESMAAFVKDGGVYLYHNGSQKLQTTATGIDVTGTVTADGATIDGEIILDSATGNHFLKFYRTDSTINAGNALGQILFGGSDDGDFPDAASIKASAVTNWTTTNSPTQLDFYTTKNTTVTPVKRLTVADSGDISFFSDDGTSQDFYWDASTSRLGLGTTSPSYTLDLGINASGHAIRVGDSNADAYMSFGNLRSLIGYGTSQDSIVIQGGLTKGIAFNVNNSTFGSGEAMRIDDQGRLGIGEANPDRKLTITNGSDNLLILRVNGADKDSEYFGVGVQSEAVTITAGSSGSDNTNLIFRTASSGSESEAARIDSSGNLLVGTTNINSYTDNTAGVVALATGRISASRSGIVAGLNRIGSDGTIADFRKDGSTVGSIGVLAGHLGIAEGNCGLRFESDTQNIIPASTSYGTNDASVNLGRATGRFNNLWLSGGVYLGGTTSANLLDSYEEGGFVPVLADAISGGNESDTTLTGKYVKVGALVYIQIIGTNINTTGLTAGNHAFITGLPFTVQPTGGVNGTCAVWANQFTFTDALVFEATQGTTYGRFVDIVSGSTITYITLSDIADDVADFKLSLTYRTDA